MKVLVSQQDLKLFDGTDYIQPQMGDIIELPKEIAEAEIAAGFVERLEGEEEETVVRRVKKKSKKKKEHVEEDEEEDD